MKRAIWNDAGRTAVLLIDDDGTHWATAPGDPRLQGLAIEPYAPPPGAATRVRSLPPVALRKALRRTPAPGPAPGDALAYIQGRLALAGMEEARDAFEYMVRAERADMLALGAPLGFAAAQIDAVLALGATLADPADVVREPA